MRTTGQLHPNSLAYKSREFGQVSSLLQFIKISPSQNPSLYTHTSQLAPIFGSFELNKPGENRITTQYRFPLEHIQIVTCPIAVYELVDDLT